MTERTIDPTLSLTREDIRRCMIFETNHWDGPLTGLARIGSSVYYFDAAETDEYGDITAYKLTAITGLNKGRALFGKWWFEFCVGTYWSYDRKRRDYHPNRPRWMRRVLWRAFYGHWAPRGSGVGG